MADNRKIRLSSLPRLSAVQRILLGIGASGVLLAGIFSLMQTEQTQEVSTVFGSMILKGSASKSGNVFTLTPNSFNTGGAAWFSERVSLNSPFVFETDVNFGSLDPNGADGIAFVFHRSSSGTNALGTFGGGQGYTNITPSLTIEFDTWNNGGGVYDIPQDHITYLRNGNQGWPLTSTVCITPSCTNVENGAWHRVKIEWDPSTKKLDTYFNNQLRISHTVDIVKDIFANNEWVHFGMTAATGGARNLQQFTPQVLVAAGERTPFPVEWLYVEAKEEKGNAVISWGTAKEENSDYFAVERSTDGATFEELERVQAAGTSSEQRNYSFTDYQVPASRSYYRLRQVDFDGRFEYSSIVEISLTPANALSLEVYPNPASEEVSIRAAGAAEVQVMALDAAGRQMQAGTLRPGDRRAELKWNVSDWPAGYYIITLQAGQQQTQQKLLVQ